MTDSSLPRQQSLASPDLALVACRLVDGQPNTFAAAARSRDKFDPRGDQSAFDVSDRARPGVDLATLQSRNCVGRHHRVVRELLLGPSQ